MSRRSICLALGFLVVSAVGGAVAVVLLVRHEPTEYAWPPMPAETGDRRLRSREFYERFSALINAIKGDQVWDEEFSDEQINSYLEDEFVRSGADRNLLPEGISRPRVVFGNDRIQ